MTEQHECEWWKVRVSEFMGEVVCREGCTMSISDALGMLNGYETIKADIRKYRMLLTDCQGCYQELKRATQAPERPCEYCESTLVDCYDARKKGAIKCCPDCKHERVKDD